MPCQANLALIDECHLQLFCSVICSSIARRADALITEIRGTLFFIWIRRYTVAGEASVLMCSCAAANHSSRACRRVARECVFTNMKQRRMQYFARRTTGDRGVLTVKCIALHLTLFVQLNLLQFLSHSPTFWEESYFICIIPCSCVQWLLNKVDFFSSSHFFSFFFSTHRLRPN